MALPAVTFDKSKTVVGHKSVLAITNGAGVRQITTATAAGAISTSGNLTATITGAGITGSPVALSVAVLNGDTAAMWAQKVRLAILGNAPISAVYDVAAGLGATIVLTRKVAAANDATLNIALANGTSVGATTAATSAATLAGSAAGPVTNILVDYLGDRSTLDVGRSVGIGADNGPAYTATTWAKARAEMYAVRTREIKKVLTLMGSLTGHFDGSVIAYIRDPKDVTGKAAMVSDDFPMSIYRDPTEIAHTRDNVSEVTLIIESLKDGPVTWTPDADVS